MCYEQRFFWRWVKSRADQREEIQSHDTERSRVGERRVHLAPQGEVVQRKEVEREFEEVV